MNSATIRRLTGGAGLVAAIMMLIEVPLYFVYSDAPPDSNVLTRDLFGLLGFTFAIVFMTGVRQMIKNASPGYEWVAGLASVAGLMWLTVEFISTGLEAGAVIASPTPIDPTIAVSGTYILYGTVSRLLMMLFFVAFGYAVLRTGVLSRWVGRSSYALAVVNLAFVPTLFFGNTPAHFYAANGWGTTASLGAIFMIWLLSTSIATIRGREHAPTTPAVAA